MSLKQNAKLFVVVILAAMICWPLVAKVVTNVRSSRTGITGLECQIKETRTSSDEWLRDNDWYSFRTTNGKSATITVDSNRSTFNNCKVVYSSAFASSTGDWSSGGLQVEALSHDAWSCNLAYSVSWK
jgi:hypothetical protein